MRVIVDILCPRLLFLTLSPEGNRVISVLSQMSTITKDLTRERTGKIKSASWTDSKEVWSMLPMSKRTKRTGLLMIAWGCEGWTLILAFFPLNSSSNLNWKCFRKSKAGECLAGKWLVFCDEMSGLWSCRIIRPLWCPVSKYEVIDFRALSKAQHHGDQANILQIMPTLWFYEEQFQEVLGSYVV